MVTVSGNANCLKLAPLQLYFWSRLQNRTTCISYGFLETDGVLTPTICVQNNDNSSVISIVFFGVMSRIIVLLSFSLRTHHNAQQLSSICNVHTLNCALKRTDLWGFYHIKGTLQTISDSVSVVTCVIYWLFSGICEKHCVHADLLQTSCFFLLVSSW